MTEEEQRVRIRHLRDTMQTDVFTAKKIVRGEQLQRMAKYVTYGYATENEMILKDVLLEIIKDLYPSAPEGI